MEDETVTIAEDEPLKVPPQFHERWRAILTSALSEFMKSDRNWSWKGWGISRLRKARQEIRTPWFAIGVDNFRQVTSTGFSRGRCQERWLRVPLTKRWQVTFSTAGKDYLTLVGGPEYLRNLNWILDEFDSSFNDLAIASLRYHLDYSVCDNEDNRERYEDVIARLSEESPTFTDEEMAILQPPGWSPKDDFEYVDGRMLLKRANSAQEAIYKAFHQREDEYRERIQQARHDFVDLMPMLWS
ncbi:hypothetical protein PBI_GAIA_63 [Mycobacterium phage Gaia]|uniref:Uncharacterized protein n=1 Tax=Mycobacterium phage Gaia TaxID=1486472 RepID=A0A068F1Q8_9CAUD|nr:hypothetical protein VC46_gp170 [Mycobacterium phage Gaia]AID58882.1 hypothetical protein PBI_GAIA_63 [Mycobacterium phage Gaia]AYR00003.1 hypothetical protein PBI_NEBKISS_64 [Mycobacterium phage Nebkiss]